MSQDKRLPKPKKSRLPKTPSAGPQNVEAPRRADTTGNYRSIFENAVGGVFQSTPEGRYLAANPALAQMLGYGSPAELLASVTDIGGQVYAEPQRRAELLRRLAERGAVENFETALRRKDGARMWVSISARPVRDGQGRMVCVEGIVENITPRKRAEEALAESEHRYRALFTESREAMDVTIGGRIEDVNAAWLKLHGYGDRTEVVGKDILDVLHPEDHEKLAEWRRMPNRNVSELRRFRNLRKDGSVIDVEVYSSEIFIGGQRAVLTTVRDITERRRAEEKLRQSEANLAAAQRIAHVGSWMAELRNLENVSQSPLWWSDETYRIFGYEPGTVEVTHEMFARAIAPADRDRVWAEVRAALHERRPYNVEHRLLRPDGTERIVHEHAEVVCDPDTGRPRRFLGTVQDITERKRAEEELKQSHSLLGATLECTADGILVVDTEGKVTSFNRKFLDLWHIPESLAAKREDQKLLQFVLDQLKDPASFLAKIEELYRHPAAVSSDELEFRDGRVFERYSQPQRLGDAIVGRVWSFRDITERKQAEEEHLRLGTAVEQAAEAILITDAAGSILYVNPAFEKITGYNRQEALGQNPRLLKSGKHDNAFYRQMWAALLRGEVWQGRVTNRRKDGAFYEEEATISPIRDAAGRIVNYVGVKRDVTREAALEIQFRQSQKMEAVGRLAGGIAHDFNNILTAILGYCELTRGQIPGDHPARSHVTAVQESAQRAASLTSQLLAFSRKQVLLPQPLDLNAVVNHLKEMLRRLISENIKIVTQLDPAAGGIKADVSQIEQVIMNLAVNAGDAMPRGGTLTIATANAELDEAYARNHVEVKPGPYVRLSVSDTGVGMTAEVRAHLFEPFFTTKQVGKGTGLGLATVYGIIMQSGGHVTVTSEPGRGSTFDIYLPQIQDATASDRPARTGSVAPRGVETVLLVEDEPRVREMVREILAAAGFTVLEASDGADALWLAKRQTQPIHLLLTDVVMPGLGGLELSRRLSAERPQMRVLFMSGYVASDVVPDQFLKPGAGFLQKPFLPDVLVQRVRELLDAPSPAPAQV
ncbi:MAG: PAS domain S-box protein [Verrucomicrobia bacterium]|nr:PAS domain S-box protein [Verrucomicrobiota bacterium]